MPHAPIIFARWLLTLGLALWLGGLLTIGALVAPVTAHFVQSHPAFAADPAQKGALLTGIVGGSLRAFNFVCDVCGVFLLIGQMGLWRDTPRRLAVGSLIVTLALIVSALVLGFVFFPRMDAAQAAGQMNVFDTLHRRYEAVSLYFQFPLLLVLMLLGSMQGNAKSPSRA